MNPKTSQSSIIFKAWPKNSKKIWDYRNWIISACAFRVNSRALYAYIRECAYNAVILSPTQQPDVCVMRAGEQARQAGNPNWIYIILLCYSSFYSSFTSFKFIL